METVYQSPDLEFYRWVHNPEGRNYWLYRGRDKNKNDWAFEDFSGSSIEDILTDTPPWTVVKSPHRPTDPDFLMDDGL